MKYDRDIDQKIEVPIEECDIRDFQDLLEGVSPQKIVWVFQSDKKKMIEITFVKEEHEEEEELSPCCSAEIVMHGLCRDCKEHI